MSFFVDVTCYHEVKIPTIFNSQVANHHWRLYAGHHEFVAL
jgi:hypothetical protein